MGKLDDFVLVEAISGIPTVAMTKNGISFNKTTIEKLNRPEYVKVLIDRKGNRIAITPCDKNDRGARSFYKEGRDTANGVRWNNFDLKSIIQSMMRWNFEDKGRKAEGFYSDEDNALIFDLREAITI